MSFLFFNNTNIEFLESEILTWQFYNTIQALPSTNQVQLIDQQEFAKTAVYENSETFVVYVAA